MLIINSRFSIAYVSNFYIVQALRREEKISFLFFTLVHGSLLPFSLSLLSSPFLLLPLSACLFFFPFFFSFWATTIIRKHWPLSSASTGSGSHLFLRE